MDRNDDLATFGLMLMALVLVLAGLLTKAQSDRATLRHQLTQCEATK